MCNIYHQWVSDITAISVINTDLSNSTMTRSIATIFISGLSSAELGRSSVLAADVDVDCPDNISQSRMFRWISRQFISLLQTLAFRHLYCTNESLPDTSLSCPTQRRFALQILMLNLVTLNSVKHNIFAHLLIHKFQDLSEFAKIKRIANIQ